MHGILAKIANGLSFWDFSPGVALVLALPRCRSNENIQDMNKRT
jgi:hypothetical protein